MKKEIKTTENKDNPTWVECTKCGKEYLMHQGKDSDKYVCKRCSKGAGKDKKEKVDTDIQISEIELVTINCRRHKRLIEVPKGWLDTCTYLCPQCYYKLKAKERKLYSPKKKSAKRKIEKHEKLTGVKDGKVGKAVKVEVDNGNKEKVGEQVAKVKLSDLMPQNKLHCEMCGKDVMVYRDWYRYSKCICPECYSTMREEQIAVVHIQQENKAKGEMPRRNEIRVRRKSAKEYKLWDKNSRYNNKGGVWSTSQICKATVEDLKRAVSEGLVSKVRAKIELRRRKEPTYLNSLPEYMNKLPVIDLR
jgi:protein-arginine kinase activator protein McsA